MLRVYLLGQLIIQRGEQDLTKLLPHKLQELFCYLLLFQDRAHPRETLAGLLWADSSTSQSRRNLRQTLWQLQKTEIIQGPPRDSDVILADQEWIRVNPDADLWLDVEVLERAFSRIQGVPGQALDAAQAQALQDAVELYRGDLLEGWYQDWCLYERERLQNIYLCILEKLMNCYETCGEYEAGLACGTRALRSDGARERTHRRLMRLYYLAGQRSRALRQYDMCVKALRRELDVRPSARTVALYRQIREGRFAAPTQSSISQSLALPPKSAGWPEMLEYLRWLQNTLKQIERQLRDVIDLAERASNKHP